MADRKRPGFKIQPYYEESFFVVRMPRVRQDAGMWVGERVGGGLEAHAVFFDVGSRLAVVPFEVYVSTGVHRMLIMHILYI